MEKKLLMLAVVFIVVALTGSAAMALAPMGTPTAGLKLNQFRAGLDYSYSKMDIEGSPSDGDDYTIKDFTSNGIWANLGYGIADSLEAFVRLGAANGDFDEVDDSDDIGYSGDYQFSYGFGAKWTFWQQQEKLDWGTLFQMDWLKTKDAPDEDDIEIAAYEIQVAVGPTWKASDNLSIYGGPFVHFLRGDVDFEGGDSDDLKEKSEFGGYVGAQADLTESTLLFGEFQYTGDGWAFGTGVGWKF